MVRRLAAFLLLLLAGIVPLHAGDFAERNVIGFSPDGAYFAFEEYGVQDGSGFPYANIYVIDVARDAWVEGSPFRTLLRDGDAGLIEARAETGQMADALLRDLEILHAGAPVTGNTVLTRHYTDLADDPYHLRFRPRLVAPPIDEPYDIGIDIYKAGDDGRCHGFAESMGYRLTLEKAGGPRVILHEDTDGVPESRGCAHDYRVHDVITYYPPGAEPVVAILVQYLRVGFEGPDGRFLAVTGKLPQ